MNQGQQDIFALLIVNSGLLTTVLVMLLRFHGDWSRFKLMVLTLWAERETALNARIAADAVQASKATAVRAGG